MFSKNLLRDSFGFCTKKKGIINGIVTSIHELKRPPLNFFLLRKFEGGGTFFPFQVRKPHFLIFNGVFLLRKFGRGGVLARELSYGVL